MLDHVSLPVACIERSAGFYDAVLAELGYERRKQRDGSIGYGPESRAAPVFWIHERVAGHAAPGPGLHVSFQAASHGDVEKFHATALAHGGRDAGAPGWRPQYTMPFFGAFVLDPDGYKIEAVCRRDDPGRAGHLP